MMERRTEDNNHAAETDTVYEIMYQWLNAEVSTPYPSRAIVAQIPITAKIWTHECNCQKECNKIIKSGSKPGEPCKLILPL